MTSTKEKTEAKVLTVSAIAYKQFDSLWNMLEHTRTILLGKMLDEWAEGKVREQVAQSVGAIDGLMRWTYRLADAFSEAKELVPDEWLTVATELNAEALSVLATHPDMQKGDSRAKRVSRRLHAFLSSPPWAQKP